MAHDNPIRNIGEQLGRFLTDAGAREDLQKSLNVIAQGGFAKLDLVTREQFDAQLEKLERAQQLASRLEAQVEELQARLDALEEED